MSQVLTDFRNIFRRRDDALTQLIIINVSVFVVLNVLRVVLELSMQGAAGQAVYEFVQRQLVLPSALPELVRKPWTLLTYFFSHTEVFHIFWNMVFLYWFGQLIQEYLGARRLISLYILGGVAGGLLYIAAYNIIPYYRPLAQISILIGASGAVYAVVAGAATLLPNFTFNLLFIGSVRIVYIAAAYIGLSFFQITSSNPGGNLAHLGGALMGFIFVRQLRNGRDLGAPITYTFAWLGGIWASITGSARPQPARQQRQYSTARAAAKPQARATTSQRTLTAGVDQEEIDAILDKIGHTGYDSLTKEEKQKLFNASQG